MLFTERAPRGARQPLHGDALPGLATLFFTFAFATGIGRAAPLPREAALQLYGTNAARETAPSDSDAEFFRDLKVEPQRGTVGGGGLTIESPALSDPAVFMPGVNRHLRPEDAEVKIGQLYLDLLSVSGSVLHTDNVDLAPSDGEGRTISIFRMGAGAFYRFTEQLQFGVAGQFVYLPSQDEFGIAGFGIDDPFYAFTRYPIFLAQIDYDASFDEWELELFNRFAVHAAPSTETALGFEFEEEDRANRHVFRDPFTRRSATDAFLIRTNTIGASANRLFPSVTRFTVGANHSDWWYDDEPQGRRLPDSRDQAFIVLASERENLRLKPFASYEVDRYDSDPWTHEVRSGLTGPLSEYVMARAEAGYFWADDVDRHGRLWFVRIRHTPRPLTYHQIIYSQSLSDPLRDLDRTWTYTIRHKMNSTITAHTSVARTDFEFLDIPGTEGDEWGAFAGFSAAVISNGGIAFRGGYERRRFDDRALGFEKSWVARTSIRYQSIQGDVNYRYINRDSERADLNYEEHVIMFTLTKFF